MVHLPREPESSRVSTPVRVTFDTNVWSDLVDSDKEARDGDCTAIQRVRAALNDGRIRGFFSEATVTLDSIGRKEKSAVLGASRFEIKTASTSPSNIAISIGPSWKRTDMHPRFRACISAARRMGMRALCGPRRFGDTLVVRGFGEDFYEPLPLGTAFLEAVDRTNRVDSDIVSRGLGRFRVIEFAKFLSHRDGASGEWWPQGLERAQTDSERKKVALAVSELADGEALAAHAGYRNDFFCTNDQGGALGKRSILHPTHREWLSEMHGISIISAAKMADFCADIDKIE